MAYLYYNNVVKDLNIYSNNWKHRQLSDFIKSTGYRSLAKIGNISYLIQSKQFNNVLEFQKFYLNSGVDSLEYRKKIFYNKTINYYERIKLIEKYGRTPDEINSYIDKMMDILENNMIIYNLDSRVSDNFNLLHDSINNLVTRDELKRHYISIIFIHSYNGIVVRESNVRYNLKKQFSNMDYVTDYDLDASSGIDCLVTSSKNVVKLGIQIKPSKYLKWNMPKLELEKHQKYFEDTGVKVYYLYADDLGNYTDIPENNKVLEILEQINKL